MSFVEDIHLSAQYELAIQIVRSIISGVVKHVSVDQYDSISTVIHVLKFATKQIRRKIGFSCFGKQLPVEEDETTFEIINDGLLQLSFELLQMFLAELQLNMNAIYKFLR